MEFYYFDIPFWRGELPRMLIKMGGLEVKDHRVTPGNGEDSELQKLKDEGKAPFRSLPVLIVGDVLITQAMGIVTFLGKRAGFYPTDDVQAAKVDEVLLMVEELSTQLATFRNVKPEDQETVGKKFIDNTKIPGNIDTLIGSKEFVVGDSITIADLLLWSMFPFLEESPFVKFIQKGAFGKYTNLQRVIANVEKNPQVAEYKNAQAK